MEAKEVEMERIEGKFVQKSRKARIPVKDRTLV